MTVEAPGESCRALALPPDPERQGAHAPQQQPRLEGAQHGSRLLAVGLDPLPESILTSRYQRACENVAMAIQVLGCRMHDDVGPEGQGARQDRRCDRVVDCEMRADLMRQRCDCRQVDDVPKRIARRLDPDKLRFPGLES